MSGVTIEMPPTALLPELEFPQSPLTRLPAMPATRPAAEVQADGPIGDALSLFKAGMMSMADLRELLALQREYRAEEARKAFADAMVTFKLDPPQILKNKRVYYVNSKNVAVDYDHATIGEVCDKVIVAAAEHGFSHRWKPSQATGANISVSCIITHRLGHSEETLLEGPRDESGGKNSIQGVGSTTTYLSRYSLLMGYGFATNDMPDDDGRGADDAIKTKGAEGAEGENKPELSPREKWMAHAKTLTTLAELEQCRLDAYDVFNEVRDVDSWNAVKTVVAEQRKKLLGKGCK